MYGTAGVADVFTDDLLPNSCSSIGAQQDGRVVVGGRSAASPAQGFARRLLSTGAVDSLFTADAVGSSMSEVTALAVAANGSIAVAGRESPGLSGALVVRLQADGHLDAMFGRQGRTVFDVESDGPVWPIVHDMQVLPDGGIVMSGGTGTWSSQRPFVVRLLGDGAGGGPGVVDIEASSNQAHEADQLARIDVRRIGGRSGPISVTYRTEAANDYPIASPGMDFTAVEGQLTWADGDDSVRTITVPVADDAEPPERPEHFLVRISAPSGGAGLAKRTSIVTIVGDGFPAGLIDVSSIPAIREGHVLTVNVSRRDYAAGAVTVDLSITGGSATAGEDYLVPGEPLRLSWADGDSLDKSIGIAIRDDDRVEPGETIVVALSGATGGAVIGTSSTVEVAIIDDDAGGGRNGGGGRIGGLFALLSGFAGWLRSRRRSAA